MQHLFTLIRKVTTVKAYKIIDSHCHIYPDKIAEKAAAGTGHFYGLPPYLDGRISTLLEHGTAAGIDHFIVQSVATPPKQVSSITHFIAEAVEKSNGKFTGLGTLHPDSDNIKAEVEEILALGLKGVKLHPEIQGFSLLDDRCDLIYKLCLKYNLALLLHTGDCRYDYSNPKELSEILERYPDLTVIGAHLGGYTVWEEAVKVLPKYKNLYVDCSSSLMYITPERATELIREYGADRVLWGTDYPMWGFEEEMERFSALSLNEEEKEQILCKNAQKLFGIKL